jgi:GNAT superfamily N-acetyltransferase
VKVLLYNAQVVSAVTQQVQTLARQADIPVVGVTETMPPSYRSCQAWQLAQAEAILMQDAGDPAAAEIAFTVADDWQGRGVGTALVPALMQPRPAAVKRLRALVPGATGLLRRGPHRAVPPPLRHAGPRPADHQETDAGPEDHPRADGTTGGTRDPAK